jgi:PDZ domain-containing protein
MKLAVKRIKKEFVIGFLLLFLPFAASYTLVVPHYEYFITTGDVVPVQQLGIRGHVYFTFVRAGHSRNLFEKYALIWTYKNIEFKPADKQEIEDEQEELEYEAELRDDTIRNAVFTASTKEVYPESELQNKMKEVMKKSEKYYGDSFGLMVALGLTEEWNHEDFSRGGRFKIAGTGTIERNKQVGPVGGIREKVLSAEKKAVHYFLVPSDGMKSPETGLSNQEEAMKVVQEKKLKIQVVPVQTLEEASAFLRALH